jgi:hypothetical protein
MWLVAPGWLPQFNRIALGVVQASEAAVRVGLLVDLDCDARSPQLCRLCLTAGKKVLIACANADRRIINKASGPQNEIKTPIRTGDSDFRGKEMTPFERLTKEPFDQGAGAKPAEKGLDRASLRHNFP